MKWTPIVAMICIAGLEALALTMKIDGATLGLAFAAIAGLGGYELKAYVDRRKRKE